MAAQFHLIIANEKLEEKEGKHPSPNVTISMKEVTVNDRAAVKVESSENLGSTFRFSLPLEVEGS